MKNSFFYKISALLFVLLMYGARASACTYTIDVKDPSNTGFAAAATTKIISILELNGCSAAQSSGEASLAVEAEIRSVYSKKRLNPIGLFAAGGLSSAQSLRVAAVMTLSAKENGYVVFNKTLTHRNSSHEYYSGFRKARGVKKRTIEVTSELLTEEMLHKILGEEAEIQLTPRGNGDLLTEDSDFWPILGGGLTSIAVHETGHFINATMTGHRADFQGNDSRTFTVGPEMVTGFSLLFGLHMNEDQLLPLLPDVVYDFQPVPTANGYIYQDDAGNTLSHGRRDSAFVSYAGVMYQNLFNEYLLTKHPNLIDEDNPRLKGMFFMNVFLPAFYPLWGYRDDNSDLRLLKQSLNYDKWQVNAMILTPIAIDVYRYYHPEKKKKLRRLSRIAKLIPVVICLSQ